MRPGQVAVQLGTWFGTMAGGGVESQALVGVEVPVSARVVPTAWAGIQRHADGTLDPRDMTVAVGWLPVARDDLVVRIQPGLSLPTGGIGSGLYFTSLSTGSVDPWLGVDVVGGSTWLIGGSLVARVPVVDGWDRIRQGAFLRADARLARRLGDVVPFVGVSAVEQRPSDPPGAAVDFAELSATAGGVWNVASRWSVNVQVRLPVWGSVDNVRQVSGGLGVRRVFGKGRKPASDAS